MSLTVIVPTFNEAPNIVELVRRVDDAIGDLDAEILFVDDSDDQTPDVIEEAALTSRTPVRLLHRSDPVGGLSGAVVEGLAMSRSDWCLVMDGDLQHPPEMIPVLLETGCATGADVVVASRHIGGGSNRGLSGWSRKLVSNGSIALTRAMFPARLRDCTDPMTGFFAVRRQSVDVRRLHPQGFKILLEILARNRLRVVEEPFIFGERHAGESSHRAFGSPPNLHPSDSVGCRASPSSAPSAQWPTCSSWPDSSRWARTTSSRRRSQPS